MSDVRCRACSAVVPERAQWCSLCFADLREPAPQAERVASAAPVAAPEAATPALPEPVGAVLGSRAGAGVLAGTALDPQTPVPGTTRPVGDLLLAAPAVLPVPAAPPADDAMPATTPAAEPVPAVAVEPTWPCPRCGDPVAISVDACPSCGAGFLSGASRKVSTRLPVVGDVTAMTSGQRWLVAMGVSAALVVILVVLLFLVGSAL